jgi:hypothetical protein
MTERERSEPPMMESAGAKGGEGPKSTRKPVSFDELFHVMVVPLFTQKGAFDLAFGMPGVTEVEAAVRFRSIVQGAEADPQVFAELQMAAGSGSVQRYLLLSDWANATGTVISVINSINNQHRATNLCSILISFLLSDLG